MSTKHSVHVSVHDAAGVEVRRMVLSQPRIRIGRVPDVADGRNDIVLPDDAVSREHAHLLVHDATITVVDRESRNFTFINSQAVREPRVLQPGDVLAIGPYVLRCATVPAETANTGPTPAPTPRPTPAPTPRPITAPTPRPTLAPTTLPDLAPADSELPVFDTTPAPSLPQTDPDLDAPAFHLPQDVELAPVEPPTPAPRGSLAAAYHDLAGRHGAPAWGRPPALAATDWPRVLTEARAAVDEPLWPEWLARELCDLGPLTAILDDAGVTAVTVPGADAILVRRGDAREVATARFSCPEAVAACFERWTGTALAEGSTAFTHRGLEVLALGRALAPNGPVLHITRGPAAPAVGLGGLALPAGAAALLQGALHRGLGLVVHGEPAADLASVAAALVADIPADRVVALVARSGTWPRGQAVQIRGDRPDAVRTARLLHPDWLIVEEVEPRDIPDLRAAARGRGLLCTVHARTAELAVLRLAGMFAAAGGADLPTSRAALALELDLLVGVRHVGGRPRVHSISELRPGGALVDLFAFTPEHAALHPTGVEPQTGHERSA